MSKPGVLSKAAWLLGGSVPRDRSDIRRLVTRASKSSHVFPEAEMSMILNVLSLPDSRVDQVMVPYGKVDWLNSDFTYAEVIEKVTLNRHSRYPVINTDEETVAGILHVKRLVGYEAKPEDRILEGNGMLQPARTVPQSKKLDAMLREFKYYRVHMAVVADDGGKPAGMVTIEDVIEHIVGAIRDEFDSFEGTKTPIRSTGKQGEWEVDGETPLKGFKSHFNLELDTERFDTVGGWIANRIGRMPKAGDAIEENGLTLKVAKTDERRVLAVVVAKGNGNSDGDAADGDAEKEGA